MQQNQKLDERKRNGRGDDQQCYHVHPFGIHRQYRANKRGLAGKPMEFNFHDGKHVCDNVHDKTCNSQRQKSIAVSSYVPFQLSPASSAERDLVICERWPAVNRITVLTSYQIRYSFHEP